MSLQQQRPDPDLLCAIAVTTTELDYVRKLLELRPDDPRRVTDELEVLARLADLKRQASIMSADYKDLGILKRDASVRPIFQQWTRMKGR